MIRPVAVLVALLALSATAVAQPLMYGSGAGVGDIPGMVGIVSQTDGQFTLLGDPTPDPNEALSGLTFDLSGRLFGSVPIPNSQCCSRLIEINPVTGGLISNIGEILFDSNEVRIVDLATQPSSGTLFGNDRDGMLYTISKTTGVATLIGDTGYSRGGLAFAPDGTLFIVGDGTLATIDPATAATLTSVSTNGCIDGLAVRPTDGVLFATECDGNDIYTIDRTTGDVTEIGDPDDDDDVSDLAFQLSTATPAPAMSTGALVLALLCLVLFGFDRVRRARLSRV